MDLISIPFSSKESSAWYELNSFAESGVTLTVLTQVISPKRIPSGSIYKIGYIDKNHRKWWFFNGQEAAESRERIIEIFKAVKEHCDENDLGTAFIYKVTK